MLLLGAMSVAFVMPLIWVASPALRFADYELTPMPYVTGVALLTGGLWLFHRSHVDLGENWSITLEVRENHRLVTVGVYRYVRHPMYLALLLYGVGQSLALPNGVAGPSYFLAVVVLIAARLGPEEQLMREEFGASYEEYAARTWRVIPGLW